MALEIGKQIKALRIQKGITQEELANSIGISYQAVSKWENGVTMPDIQLLPSLSIYFGVTIDELFQLTEEAQLQRIDNMLENERFISEEKFKYAEDFLQGLIKDNENWYKPYRLLADLYNSKGKACKAIASEYARKAVTLNPNDKGSHGALIVAESGSFGDYYCNRHAKLIEFYKGLTEDESLGRISYAFYFDQLMADKRYDEARQVLEKIKTFGPNVENLAFEGDIELEQGNEEEALCLWNENVKENKENPWAYFLRGERLVNIGKNKEAIGDYIKSMELQEKPRIVDPLVALAQVYEMKGEISKAVEAQEEKIRILKEEHEISNGELIDEALREIKRLKIMK